jgi:hypothetical protein
MNKKMHISFVLPIVLLLGVLLLGMGSLFESLYKKQINYSIERANTQADAFISNYLSNLRFIADQIKSDRDIRRVLADENFGNKEDLGDNYREFLTLSAAFSSIEIAHPNYRIGMFLKDSILYSGNYHFFFPESDLFVHSEPVEKNFYTMLKVKENNKDYEYLSFITKYNVKKTNGEMKIYSVMSQVDIDKLRKVLESAKSVEGALMYLVDEKGTVLVHPNNRVSIELPKLQEYKAMSLVKLKDGAFYYTQRVMENGWKIIGLIPKSEVKKQSSIVTTIYIAATVIMIAIVFTISFVFSKYYSGKIFALKKRVNDITEGNLSVINEEVDSSTKDEMDELYNNFEFMVSEVKRLMKEQYRLGKDVTRAEMRALQAQINPHFLYNTLDLINWGALDYGAESVAKIARDLGQFYRLSLNHGSAIISIAEELLHVECFIRIENVHYEGAIHLDTEIAEDIKNFACLNILLQPFVENAIVHGIAEHPDIKEVKIKITANKLEDDIEFHIIDDGLGVDGEEIEKLLNERPVGGFRGFGINNVNFRLKLCYGEDYGIHYDNVKPHGTDVTIRIKALTINELEEALM